MEILTKVGIMQYLSFNNIFIYLLIINVLGFFAMGIDKYKAKKGYWRISEGTLIILTLLGGGIGTISGMYMFRHKTKKMKFTIGLPTIFISEIIFIIYFLIKY